MTIATPDDLPDLLALVKTSEDGPRWPVEAWESFVAPTPQEGIRRVLFVASGSSRAIDGLLAATLLEGTTEVESVLVDAAVRGQGKGRSLVERWVRWAMDRNASQAWLEVRASNVPALRLYCAAGFVEESRRKAYYREPVEDAITMRRFFWGQ